MASDYIEEAGRQIDAVMEKANRPAEVESEVERPDRAIVWTHTSSSIGNPCRMRTNRQGGWVKRADYDILREYALGLESKLRQARERIAQLESISTTLPTMYRLDADGMECETTDPSNAYMRAADAIAYVRGLEEEHRIAAEMVKLLG